MRLAVLATLLALVAPAPAQETPFDLNGITLGTALDTIEATGRFTCIDPKSPVADRLCRLKSGEKETIADAQVKARWALSSDTVNVVHYAFINEYVRADGDQTAH